MSSTLKTSVAGMALIAILGAGLANAQTAPAPTEQPAQTAPAAPTLAVPEILQGDGFADVTSRPGRRGGLIVEGTIAETGKSFDAFVNGQGALVGMRTAEGSALPAAVLESLLPEAARANPILSEIAVLNAIGRHDGAVMAAGQDASGDDLRLGFSAEGELMHFDRGDMRGHDERGGPWMGRDGDHGKRRHGEWGGENGQRGERGDRGHHGERDGDRAERGPRHDGDRRDRGAPASETRLDDGAARAALRDAGYRDLGTAQPDAEGIAIVATNPQGEPVMVVVTAEGEVVRETAR